MRWPSKIVFILAAIGSAAGLGNLWRFPYLAYENGGAVFVLAIIIANLLIGIPLLILEVALGQRTEKAAPDAFGSFKKNFKYLGWLALIIGFSVLAYYMAVMGWGVTYLASSFTMAWKANPQDFFFKKILGLTDSPAEIGGFSWPVLAGTLIAWAMVYFSVFKGVKSVSKVVVWTATLPFLILFILIIRAVTLPGAIEGLKLFFIPEFSKLLDTKLWLSAFSQVFFSLSLAFGIMIAYGSYNTKTSDIVKSSYIIAGGNFLVSLMSGIVVFGTLGYMAQTQGVPVQEVFKGGPSLAFVAFPQAISLLPALNALIAVLFFVMLLSLAVDSAFSLLEAVSRAFQNRFPKIKTEKIALSLTLVGIFLGLIFTTKAGLYYLDIVDHFLVNYGLVVVGILEAIIIGYFIKTKEFMNFINKVSEWKIGNFWLFAIKFIIPVFLIILLVVNFYNEIKSPYENYPVKFLIGLGVLPVILAPIIAVLIDKLTLQNIKK